MSKEQKIVLKTEAHNGNALKVRVVLQSCMQVIFVLFQTNG